MNKPPDISVLRKYKLVYYNGDGMVPAYIGPSETFISTMEIHRPTYAVYQGGTNRLVILEKKHDGEWNKVELSEVQNLYGLIWHIVAELAHLKHVYNV
jgi:hypothetical protein